MKTVVFKNIHVDVFSKPQIGLQVRFVCYVRFQHSFERIFLFALPEEVILNEDQTTDEEKMKIIEGMDYIFQAKDTL